LVKQRVRQVTPAQYLRKAWEYDQNPGWVSG
jgi:hypothetical protein